MPISVEGFLAFGAYEMLDTPMFAESSDHTSFNGTSTGPTNRNSHLEIALQAVQFIQLIGRVSRSCFDFDCARSQFFAASLTIEMVGTVDFTPESEWFSLNDLAAFLAHVFSFGTGFHFVIAFMT